MSRTKYHINKEGKLWDNQGKPGQIVSYYDIDIRTNNKEFMDFVNKKLDKILKDFSDLKDLEEF